MVNVCIIILQKEVETVLETLHLNSMILELKKENIEVIYEKEFINKIENWIKEKQREAIVIGDTQSNLEMAKRWNIPSIGLWIRERQEDLSGACVLVESFQGVNKEYLNWVQKRAFHQPITIAKTKNLELRELLVEDMDQLYTLYQKTKQKEFLSHGEDTLHVMQEKQKAYIKNCYEFYNFGLWGVFLLENSKLIGYCGIQNTKIGEEAAIELGYFIGDNYQRKGYGTEATEAVFCYAKNKLELERIVAAIDMKNQVSISFAKSIGMSEYKRAYVSGKKVVLFEKVLLDTYNIKIRKKYNKGEKKDTRISRKSVAKVVYNKLQEKPDNSVYEKKYLYKQK